MNRLEQMKHQHIEVHALIEAIKNNITRIEDRDVQFEVAKNISKMAGILKIHLSTEDNFLYPAFMKSDNGELVQKATSYKKEMGNLSQQYLAYKDKYNTQSKIQKNMAVFKNDSRVMFDLLEKRIGREDSDLYCLAEGIVT